MWNEKKLVFNRASDIGNKVLSEYKFSNTQISPMRQFQ